MLVAGLLAHRVNGFFVFREGCEYVLVLGVVSLALGMLGPGWLSLDHAAGIATTGWRVVASRWSSARSGPRAGWQRAIGATEADVGCAAILKHRSGFQKEGQLMRVGFIGLGSQGGPMAAGSLTRG